MARAASSDSTAALQGGFRRSGWTTNDLWVAAVGIGGELRRGDVDAITGGHRPATRAEHDVLATALNDHFVDQGHNRPVALWNDLEAGRG